MHTTAALLDIHERAHRSLRLLLEHCGQLSAEELNRELAGFGYPTVESLEMYRRQVFTATEEYLRAVSSEELNSARQMMTWGNRQQRLIPAHVVLRTSMHLYHHQGQIVAMCRLLGKPAPGGMDFPLA